MKNIFTFILLLSSIFVLTSCGESEKAMTEAEQAAEYNMSVEEYKNMKDAAARMNMTIEEHMKHVDMGHGDHSEMNMSDDSNMIDN